MAKTEDKNSIYLLEIELEMNSVNSSNISRPKGSIVKIKQAPSGQWIWLSDQSLNSNPTAKF